MCNAITLQNTVCKQRNICGTDYCRIHTITSKEFQMYLECRGQSIIQTRGDGNCLFRAISSAIGGEFDHEFIRDTIVLAMSTNRHRWAPFIDEPIDDYISHMSRNGTWGSDIEIQIAAEIFGVYFTVISMDGDFTFGTDGPEIKLAYNEQHYSRLI